MVSDQERNKDKVRDEERKKMSSEIDSFLNRGKHQRTEEEEEEQISHIKKSRIGLLPDLDKNLSSPPETTIHAAHGFILEDKTKKKQQQVNL